MAQSHGNNEVWAMVEVTTHLFVPIYPLTVSKDGTGSGEVVSTPPGIECGTDCTEAMRMAHRLR